MLSPCPLAIRWFRTTQCILVLDRIPKIRLKMGFFSQVFPSLFCQILALVVGSTRNDDFGFFTLKKIIKSIKNEEKPCSTSFKSPFFLHDIRTFGYCQSITNAHHITVIRYIKESSEPEKSSNFVAVFSYFFS